MYVIGVFDNPNNDLEMIAREQEIFQDYMSALMDKNDFKYEAFQGKSLKNLMKFIDNKKDKLSWFHFSGHHDVDDGIRLNDGNFSTLAEQLLRCKNLKGVFINGCASKSTLDKLSKSVPICIGTYKPVYDGLATEFSEMFYEKMKNIDNWKKYDDFHEAFEATKLQIRNLYKDGNIKSINEEVRGGGSQEELELDNEFYFISKINNESKEQFEQIRVHIDPVEYVKNINEHLTKELLMVLSDEDKPKKFLSSIPSEDIETWETKPDHLKKAQGILEDVFIWVIGSELRRLFAIGHYKKEISLETKIEEYIDTCFKTYRSCLQLIIYLFISKLWDVKRKNPDLNTDHDLIKNFFIAKRKLKLNQLRNLFQLMIQVFEENSIEYPVDKSSLGDLNDFLDSKSDFNQACAIIENLEEIDDSSELNVLDNLIATEKSLATVLSKLKFFAKCKLMTIKKIEYEESRYSKVRYIKDITVLGKEENEDNTNFLKIDEKPEKTYSVMFIQPFMNGNKIEYKKVNMFPFLLDFNALINEDSFDLIFYEFWDGESGIDYFSLKSEEDRLIHYKKIEDKMLQGAIARKDRRNRMKKIRLNIVTKQFEVAMNTLVPGKHEVTNMPVIVDENLDAISGVF